LEPSVEVFVGNSGSVGEGKRIEVVSAFGVPVGVSAPVIVDFVVPVG
jgi:hypothetical protein